jgi:hypothetical protein
MVTSKQGYTVFFDQAVELMDSILKEELYARGFDGKQEFYDAYCEAHKRKYNEEFLFSGKH